MSNTKNHKTALLIIDMINDFSFQHGSTLLNKAIEITIPIKKLKEHAKHSGIPIIYINDHYNLWQANIDKIIKYCTNEQTKHYLHSIVPDENDYFLIKPKHSAFFGTALNTLLYQLDVKTLILTGVAGNICVLFTANDAYMREYELIVPSNCIASVSDEDNEYALKMMANVLKADISNFKKS